jgi:hypothetical protein
MFDVIFRYVGEGPTKSSNVPYAKTFGIEEVMLSHANVEKNQEHLNTFL